MKNNESKLGSPPQAVDITIHYTDGTSETVKQGMLTSLSPDGVVNVLCLGITVDDFIKVMSALQGGIREIINGSNTGPQEPE